MDKLNFRSYLEGICTILYDTLRPFIIHINHLETLAEICGILKTEMLDEHVQHHGNDPPFFFLHLTNEFSEFWFSL